MTTEPLWTKQTLNSNFPDAVKTIGRQHYVARCPFCFALRDSREEDLARGGVLGRGPVQGDRHLVAVVGVGGGRALGEHVDGAGGLLEGAQPAAASHVARLDEEALQVGAGDGHCKQNTHAHGAGSAQGQFWKDFFFFRSPPIEWEAVRRDSEPTRAGGAAQPPRPRRPRSTGVGCLRVLRNASSSRAVRHGTAGRGGLGGQAGRQAVRKPVRCGGSGTGRGTAGHGAAGGAVRLASLPARLVQPCPTESIPPAVKAASAPLPRGGCTQRRAGCIGGG